MRRSSPGFTITGILLLALAGAIAFWPGLAARLSGYRPFEPVRAVDLDDQGSLAHEGATAFFDRRNRVEIEVAEATTAGELLRRYQLYGYRHVRRQIAEQLGLPAIDDSTPLEAGQRLEVTLTPPEGESP